MRKFIAILVSLLLLLPASFAASSFSVTTAGAEQAVCATDTILFIAAVSNTGADRDSYTVSLSGAAASWAVAAPAGFALDAGNTESVYVYVTPSSNAQQGTYNLLLTVNAQNAGKQELPLTVVVGDCHSASLTSDTAAQDVCAGTPAQYALTLANNGKYTETFLLSTSGTAAKWATLSDLAVKLKAGESKTVTVTSTPPADQTGLFDLTVTAKAEGTSAVASAPLNVNSKNCYEFDFTPDKNYFSFCENSEVKIPLTINNKGNLDNTYTVTVSGPSWATVEEKSVDVPASASRVTNLVLFPGFGTSGDFPINVKALGANGDAVSEDTITANVQTCHSTDLKIGAAEDALCPFTQKVYAVSLKNTGTFDERYVLTVKGADFATLDKSIVDVVAGAAEDVNLLVDTSNAAAGSFAISVEAEAQDPAHASSSDNLNLKITPLEGCFGVQATAALTRVKVAPGEGALVPVVIENKGSEESTYNLEVTGTGAAFAKLNPASITLDGKQAKTVYLYLSVPQETAFKEYKLTVSARIEDGTVSSSSLVDLEVVPPTEKQLITGLTETPQAKVQNAISPLQAKADALRDSIRAFLSKILHSVKSMANPQQPEVKVSIVAETPVAEEAAEESAAVAEAPTLGAGEKQTVTIGGEEHSITVTEVGNDTALITVESEPQTGSLNVGESKEFDVNGDGVADLKVTLVAIVDGKARLEYEEIAAPAEETVVSENETAAPAEEVSPEVTAENVSEVEEPLAGEAVDEEIPEEVKAGLSQGILEKLGQAKESIAAPAEKPKASTIARIKNNVNKVLGLAGLEFDTSVLRKVRDFTFSKTYNVPNGLWLIGIIIVLAAISYLLKEEEQTGGKSGGGQTQSGGKGLFQKFLGWLEEEDELEGKPKEGAKTEVSKKVKAQDILDDVSKGKKKSNSKGKKGKKVIIDEDKLNEEEDD